jgi:type IV pilus assembly protein PilO
MGLLPTDPRAQRAVLLGTLPLLAVFGYWYLVHQDRTKELEGMQSHLELLETKNAAARALAARSGPELKKKVALYEQHAVRLEELIPKNDEVPDLLHDITMRAEEAGVELNLMRPDESTAVDAYTRPSFSMSVFGPYDGIGHFLAAVGSLPRIITPLHLKLVARTQLDRSGAVRLQADFQIQTYVAQEPAASAGGPGENRPNHAGN